MPARGRRTPTKPKTPTLSQLKETYAAKAAPATPTRVIYPTVTQPAVPTPAQQERPPSWAPYAPSPAKAPTVTMPKAEQVYREWAPYAPYTPPIAQRPTVEHQWNPYGYSPVTGEVYQPELPYGRLTTGYDPASKGIWQPLKQTYMPLAWARDEQKRAEERYLKGPGAPWPEPKTEEAPWTPLPPSAGGGGGYGGTVYRRPASAGGGRGVVGRTGLVMWRIGVG